MAFGKLCFPLPWSKQHVTSVTMVTSYVDMQLIGLPDIIIFSAPGATTAVISPELLLIWDHPYADPVLTYLLQLTQLARRHLMTADL